MSNKRHKHRMDGRAPINRVGWSYRRAEARVRRLRG